MKIPSDLTAHLNGIIARAKSEGGLNQLDYQHYDLFTSELKNRGYTEKKFCGFSRVKKSFWRTSQFNEDFTGLNLLSVGNYFEGGPIRIQFKTRENTFSYSIPISSPSSKFVRFSFARGCDGLYLAQRTKEGKGMWVDDKETIIIPEL